MDDHAVVHIAEVAGTGGVGADVVPRDQVVAGVEGDAVLLVRRDDVSAPATVPPTVLWLAPVSITTPSKALLRA